MIQSITVRHNVEMSHRLFQTPGKCQRIHGHSFGVSLTLAGPVDGSGMVAGIDFGTLKTYFRGHLDTNYDHRTLLNRDDPWAGKIHLIDTEGWHELPGLQTIDCDPTTENFARIIGEWAQSGFREYGIEQIIVSVRETAVNQADWVWMLEDAVELKPPVSVAEAV